MKACIVPVVRLSTIIYLPFIFNVIREEKEPLRPAREQMNLNGDKASLTVEYDGRQVFSKSGEIIGKHSAV